MLSIEDSKKKIDLYVINDTLNSYEGIINYKLYNFDGKILLDEQVICKVLPNSSGLIHGINIADLKGKYNLKESVLVADLVIDGKVISHKTFIFDKEKNVELPKATLSSSVVVENGVAKITVKSDKFARLVRLHSKTITKPFSDNYFDILPDEEKVITIECQDMTAEQVKEDLVLSSVCDVVPKGSKFSDNLFRLKVFIIPINFGNWIYYSSIPKSVKV